MTSVWNEKPRCSTPCFHFVLTSRIVHRIIKKFVDPVTECNRVLILACQRQRVTYLGNIYGTIFRSSDNIILSFCCCLNRLWSYSPQHITIQLAKELSRETNRGVLNFYTRDRSCDLDIVWMCSQNRLNLSYQRKQSTARTVPSSLIMHFT